MICNRVPNLFIVGAPKCGTTAMSLYLARHPDVFMSEQAGNKEPEYYATDFRFGWTAVTRREDYLALFAGAPDRARYLGEASVSYLHSRVAAARILADSPEARLIVMVRNPVEIARGLHNQAVKYSAETIVDFEKAWRAQGARLEGRRLPRDFKDGRALQYGELSRVGVQLSRLLEVAPAEQVHIVVYDDFARDTAKAYADTLDFLGLERNGMKEFPPVNPSVNYRLPFLHQTFLWAREARERLHFPGGWGVQKLIERINTLQGPPPLRRDFYHELQAYFQEDVEILTRLLNRDLSHWLG